VGNRARQDATKKELKIAGFSVAGVTRIRAKIFR
jgi:hypothetical protein